MLSVSSNLALKHDPKVDPFLGKCVEIVVSTQRTELLTKASQQIEQNENIHQKKVLQSL